MTTSTTQMPDMVVTGHLIGVTRPDGALKYLYRGEPVPNWVGQWEFNHLIANDLIQLVDQTPPAEPTRPPAVVDMPDMLITAALVQMRRPDGQVVYAYQGTALPKWVNQAEYDNLLSLGYIEPTDPATYAAAAQPVPFVHSTNRRKGIVR